MFKCFVVTAIWIYLNRYTEIAALELMDRNISAMNDQLTPIIMHLDLSKAFDSLAKSQYTCK